MRWLPRFLRVVFQVRHDPIGVPMFTLVFWKDTAERAITTAAQFVIGGMSLSDMGPVNAFALDWQLALGFAVGGAAMAVLTALAAGAAGRRPR